MKTCKRCLLLESAEEDTLALIREKITAIPAADKADDTLYQARLAACKTCDHLLSGVCVKCGCYVEFRAAYKRLRCPNVRDRRW